MKVYVITQGSYSDYHIVGVKLTREEAEKVVALANDEDSYEYAEIEEYDTDDIKIDTSETIKDRYWREHDCKTLDGTWTRVRTTFKSENKVTLNKSFTNMERYDKILVIATFPHGTPREKAHKIMRDRAAKFKAEREGL